MEIGENGTKEDIPKNKSQASANTRKRLFFSYNFRDKNTVTTYYSILDKYTNCEIYFFDAIVHKKEWSKAVEESINACDYFLLFMGEHEGNTQKEEYEKFKEKRKFSKEKKLILIHLENYKKENFKLVPTDELGTIIQGSRENSPDIFSAVKEISEKYLSIKFDFGDDLPKNHHLFDYEKKIIDFFITKRKLYDKYITNLDEINLSELQKIIREINKEDKLIDTSSRVGHTKRLKDILKKEYENIHKKLLDGCPPEWPHIEKKEGDKKNTLTDIGTFRPNHASVIAAALSNYHKDYQCFCMNESNFTFPEAGPREKLYFPSYKDDTPFIVAVLVSGGIAPGINAVIDGITQRHYKYFNKERQNYQSKTHQEYPNQLEILGLLNGFKSFENLRRNSIYLVNDIKLVKSDAKYIVTSDHINEGGSIIGTSREKKLLLEERRSEYLDEIVRKLKSNRIRILYIIGGDGSMKAAHAIVNIANKKYADEDWNLSVVGIPKTMDNDILWVWQTFGFLSAVEKARELIDNLAIEVKSNPRLGVVQLFGSDSGFVVSHAVLASRTGICDVALIPEVQFSMKMLKQTLMNNFNAKGGKYGLIVMAETAIPTDAMDYVDYIDKIPEHIDKDCFDLNKLPQKSQTLFKRFYNSNSDDSRYSLKSKNEYTYEDSNTLRDLLNEIKFAKFINFGYISKGIFSEICSKLTGKDLNIFKNCYNERRKSNGYRYELKEKIDNENRLIQILNSIGYYNYIDIDLSKDEKNAILDFEKLRIREEKIQGQINDFLRTAGLKIVSRGIQKLDVEWGVSFRVLTNEPRHLLRAIPPSTIDIIFGNRLGTLAVDNSMAGYSDFMISQWLTEFVLVPLKLVILGRKRIPSNGIFWKSVLSKTGQPEKMT